MVAAGWEGDHTADGAPELRGAADAGASPTLGEGSTNLLSAPLTGGGQPAKTSALVTICSARGLEAPGIWDSKEGKGLLSAPPVACVQAWRALHLWSSPRGPALPDRKLRLYGILSWGGEKSL